MKPSRLRSVGDGGEPASESRARERAELAHALHEVSNALTVVLGWLEVAQERSKDGPPRDAIELAQSYARLGHGVARRAIGAAPPDSHADRSASGLARSAVLGVTPNAQQAGVSVRFETSTGVDDSVPDSPIVLQILLNLLLNAVAFSPTGGTVTLELSELDGVFSFRVSDEGPGVPAHRAATIFDDHTSTRDGGAGIGLRHSARLASSSGGKLALVDAGPGACFELTWPKSDFRSGARHPAVTPTHLDGARILVLEDDPAVLGLIELALEARGAEVATACTREELLAVAGSALEFGAALLDLSPIEDDPKSALDAMRALAGPVPVVLISGAPGGAPDGVQDEVKAWVRKPFEMGEVIDVLRSLIPRG